MNSRALHCWLLLCRLMGRVPIGCMGKTMVSACHVHSVWMQEGPEGAVRGGGLSLELHGRPTGLFITALPCLCLLLPLPAELPLPLQLLMASLLSSPSAGEWGFENRAIKKRGGQEDKKKSSGRHVKFLGGSPQRTTHPPYPPNTAPPGTKRVLICSLYNSASICIKRKYNKCVCKML